MPDEKTETVEEVKEENKKGDQEKELSVDELKAQLVGAQKRITDLNHESAGHRKKADALQEAEDKRKKDELGELDRLKLEKEEESNKRKQAEAKLQEERIKAAFVAEANKAQFGDGKRRFVNAEIAYKLAERGDVKIDGDKVTGVTEALTKLAKENDYLLEGETKQGDGVGTGRRSPTRTTGAQGKEDKLNKKRSQYGGI